MEADALITTRPAFTHSPHRFATSCSDFLFLLSVDIHIYIYKNRPPIIRTECDCQFDSSKRMYLNGLCDTFNGLWLVGRFVCLFVCITGAEARGFYYEAGCSVDLTVCCRVFFCLFFFPSSLFFPFLFNVSIRVGRCS